jgi:hypothetical protein
MSEPASMASAPRGVPILLLYPEFGSHAKQWWVGMYSFVENTWVIKTPYTLNGKSVICGDIPQPVGWHSLPPV